MNRFIVLSVVLLALVFVGIGALAVAVRQPRPDRGGEDG